MIFLKSYDAFDFKKSDLLYNKSKILQIYFLGMEFNSCDKMIKKFSSHPIIKFWGILYEAQN